MRISDWSSDVCSSDLLLVSLVKACASGDTTALTSTFEALVADERAKSHNILADRLHRALQSSVPVSSSSELRRPRVPGRDSVIASERRVRSDQRILPLSAQPMPPPLLHHRNRHDLPPA